VVNQLEKEKSVEVETGDARPRLDLARICSQRASSEKTSRFFRKRENL